MTTWDEQQKLIADAMAEFPESFGLRAFPGDVFRISKVASYVNDSGVVMLYTQRRANPGSWLDFAKGTAGELRAQIVPCITYSELGALMHAVNELQRQVKIALAEWPNGDGLEAAEREVRRLCGWLGRQGR